MLNTLQEFWKNLQKGHWINWEHQTFHGYSNLKQKSEIINDMRIIFNFFLKSTSFLNIFFIAIPTIKLTLESVLGETNAKVYTHTAGLYKAKQTKVVR